MRTFGKVLLALLVSLGFLTLLLIVGIFYGISRFEHRTPRDRKSTRLNSSHVSESRMPSSA